MVCSVLQFVTVSLPNCIMLSLYNHVTVRAETVVLVFLKDRKNNKP